LNSQKIKFVLATDLKLQSKDFVSKFEVSKVWTLTPSTLNVLLNQFRISHTLQIFSDIA
jgi:hypothetical protein